MIYKQATHLLGILLLGAIFAVSGSSSASALVIGTFDSSRTGIANLETGLFSTQARNSMGANFPGLTFSSAPTLTPAFLAGVDLLLIHPLNFPGATTPLTAGEQSALFEYVAGGGNALLLLEGGVTNPAVVVSSQSIAGVFGLTIADDGLAGILNGTPTAPDHPIFNGLFGTQTFVQLGGAGVYTNLGPYAQSVAIMDALGLPVIAVIEADAIAPGSGRVILTSDSEMFINNSLGGYFTNHETLLLNMVAWLHPVPEPSSMTLATIGLIGGAFLARRRCKR